jgi:hypothetical protein
MTFEFVCNAIASVVEEDWEAKARKLLDERIQSGDVEVR